MASKQELRSAFDRQGQAMPNCCSGASGPVGDLCLGLSGRRSIIAGRVSDWNALPQQSPGYDSVIADLDQSSALLQSAGNDAQCGAAIEAAHSALDGLEALLDGA